MRRSLVRRCNLAILFAVFAGSWISADCDRYPSTSDGIVWLLIIPFTTAAALPVFFGTMQALFSPKRVLKRPGIHQLPLARNSPLQFLWFVGRGSFVAGSGHLLGCLRQGVCLDGVVILAAGAGLILGCGGVVRLFSRRFVRD